MDEQRSLPGRQDSRTEGPQRESAWKHDDNEALSRSGGVRYSYRTGAEVDFLQGSDAYEVKYEREIAETDERNIRKLRGMESRTIVTDGLEEIRDGLRLTPLWRFLKDRDDSAARGSPS